MKKFLTFALVALALAGTGLAIKKRIAPAVAATPTPQNVATLPSGNPALPDDGVVVTYFTTDIRCPSCHKIETLARTVVEKEFAGSKRGEVVFQTVNVDRPENRHFLADYKLASKTVIVSQREQGREIRWVNLQDVWLKFGDEADFNIYVSEAVRGFLRPSP